MADVKSQCPTRQGPSPSLRKRVLAGRREVGRPNETETKLLHDSNSFTSICTVSVSTVKWIVVFRLWNSTFPSYVFRSWKDRMSRLREDVGHLLGDRVPLSSGVGNRVVVPALLRPGPDEAPMTWLEILGEIDNFPGTVDTHLLVGSSVQFNVVEHAHEDDSV